ncbi:YtcA family lipoprotein [Oecophyllibacter saccharovorans]|uniref:Uncharacterized protein YtcA n=1 Tax=Oecophyllibacter saccharovorans TaxID=2558360 RepID=A0A506USB4_9PROT|nr:YtcA family lipoprotein [Oecophyllibacter saccharovorans]QDH14877.1 hypothetical protein E3E11_02270 [Oecophyllibacter saccharovorans]TPW35068.1 hypothetical protein E3203_06215 [Oecophyllibacter saccharovorans]TPW36218.1 hypothetical protein E3202_03690 [Oecophyllibacter saccharovorans]
MKIGLLAANLPAAACTIRGTTDFPVAGAYFPSWLLCLFGGVLSALLLRVLFLALGIDRYLTLRLCTYLSLGGIIGLATWYIFFGP